MSMCILTPKIISNTIKPNETRTKLFPMMFVPSENYDLTILFDMRDTAPHNKHNDFYIRGDIHWCRAEEVGFPGEPITF